MLSSALEEHGLTPTEIEEATEVALGHMFQVLARAWAGGFTTKSTFARDAASMVAIAATENLITTKLTDELWGNRWLITADGLSFLKELEEDAIS